MPNWCFNELSIEGSAKELAKFKKKAKTKDSDLSLSNFFPMPEELKNTSSPARIVSQKEYEKTMKENKKVKDDLHKNNVITEEMSKKLIKKYKTNNWYNWRVFNWGTKWDIEAHLEEDNKNELVYFFDSAWSPPVEAIKKIAKQYPDLYFEMNYEEEGMEFKGCLSGKRKLVDECHDI